MNKWYNAGLIWKDFALYDNDGTQETDMMKAGYVGEITAESGNGTLLGDKVKVFLSNSIMASEADFDKVYDDGLADWLSSGAQAIKEERLQKWEETYGSEVMLP